ncbi:hypothetical protein NSK_005417 [Nannochloropsis salina CCMP1776]|uniref:Uncharacterized protein n=1 Tax=Nannochloropsis salina CCMP1776 TaxID=1027361 RepID=A0A4D9D163_9STRA|nr:hypothetical protein NSK_005417 [Nannochloropsis salina CCMP1776]|eukprot:TFJ83255.1 hypothetical protein NSK_005417 [Nannochloropsis salina CCMP1776]
MDGWVLRKGCLLTGVVSGIVFLLATLLLVVVVSFPTRAGNTSRLCSLLHCGLTLLSSSLGLVTAVLNLVDANFVFACLATIIAVSQAVDGYQTWERYRVVYEHEGRRRPLWHTYMAYAYICVFFCLPFLITSVYWATQELGDGEAQPSSSSANPFGYVLFFLYALSVPSRLWWDSSLGCAFINRIYELRVAILAPRGSGEKASACQQDEVLGSVARRALVYLGVSFTVNIFIHIPLLALIPFVTVYTTVFNLCFALATHFCFHSRGPPLDVLGFPVRAVLILSRVVRDVWRQGKCWRSRGDRARPEQGEERAARRERRSRTEGQEAGREQVSQGGRSSDQAWEGVESEPFSSFTPASRVRERGTDAAHTCSMGLSLLSSGPSQLESSGGFAPFFQGRAGPGPSYSSEAGNKPQEGCGVEVRADNVGGGKPKAQAQQDGEV